VLRRIGEASAERRVAQDAVERARIRTIGAEILMDDGARVAVISRRQTELGAATRDQSRSRREQFERGLQQRQVDIVPPGERGRCHRTRQRGQDAVTLERQHDIGEMKSLGEIKAGSERGRG
jgi:hypothetical protein